MSHSGVVARLVALVCAEVKHRIRWALDGDFTPDPLSHERGLQI